MCYESRGSGLIAGSPGSPNSKSVWLAMGKEQAVDFFMNPLDDDVTGRVVVYF